MESARNKVITQKYRIIRPCSLTGTDAVLLAELLPKLGTNYSRVSEAKANLMPPAIYCIINYIEPYISVLVVFISHSAIHYSHRNPRRYSIHSPNPHTDTAIMCSTCHHWQYILWLPHWPICRVISSRGMLSGRTARKCL